VIGTAVVQPLIEAGGFQIVVEVAGEALLEGNNSTGDDVCCRTSRSGGRLRGAVDATGGAATRPR